MEFSKKKKSLYKTEPPTQENNFVKEGLKLSAETVSGMVLRSIVLVMMHLWITLQ